LNLCNQITLATILLTTPLALIANAVFQTLQGSWFWSWLLQSLVLYWAIGHRSLLEHVRPVQVALEAEQLALARKRLGMIVSRDVDELDTGQMANAAIETTLENGNDATFAPIFWFCIFGAPAVIVFRLTNTLDAMWGYRTQRFEQFGKTAAKLDDVLNYVPARLVATTYALLGNARLAFQCWRQQSHLLSSPNAGPVMCAGAGSLEVRLGGPTSYHGQLLKKPFFGGEQMAQAKDIARATSLVEYSLGVWCLCLGVIFWLL